MDQPVLNQHNKQEYPPAHSAEHLINGEMARRYGCGRAFSAHVERKKSKLDFHLFTPPTADEVQSLEQYVCDAIAADVEVWQEFINQQEAAERFDLDRLPDDASSTLRVVHIGPYDECLCAGTHVERTSQIGNFRISSTSFTPAADPSEPGVFRIVFRTN